MCHTLRKLFRPFLIAALIASPLAIGTAAQGFLIRFHDRVEAFRSDRWTQFLSAGVHRLEVEGDGDTDLDCYVTDRYGNRLGEDTDSTDFCIVTWYQSTGQQVSFRIENLGDVYNRYEFRLR